MKLTAVVKTQVDEDTALLFQRRANKAGCSVAELLRDMLFVLEHGMTFGEYVAESRLQALSGQGPIDALRRTDSVPPASSLSALNEANRERHA